MELDSIQIQQYLEYLRRGVTTSESEYVSRYTALSGIFARRHVWLQSFGISKEELQGFRGVVHKIQIKELLKDLHHCANQKDFDRTWGAIRGALHNGCLTLEDVGVSKKHIYCIRANIRKTACRNLLEMLRQGAPLPEPIFHSLLGNLRAAGLKFEDIGTTETEMSRFRYWTWFMGVQKRLKKLRHIVDIHGHYLCYLQWLLTCRGFTFTEAGITEREVALHRLVAIREIAARYLSCLRKGTSRYGRYILYLRQELRRWGFSLADVGTSEKEIRKVKRLGARVAVRKWLDRLRQGHDYQLCLRFLKRELGNGELTLADFGTCKRELKEIRKSQTPA